MSTTERRNSDTDPKKLFAQYESLVKFFHKRQLKMKEAIVQDKRFPYFRHEDMIELVKQNGPEITKILKSWKITESLHTDDAAKSFVTDLIQNKIIFKLQRNAEDPKYKWPKRLFLSREQTRADDKGFYTFAISPKNKTSRFMLAFIIFCVVAVCLFNIWPFFLKIGVFYVSLVLLYFLVGLIIVRLIIYIIFRVLGFDAYLFPNLFEEVSFLDSFKPFFSFAKCEDNITGYVGRGLGLVLLAYLMFVLSQQPELIDDAKETTRQSFDDIYTWGYDKLNGTAQLANPEDNKFEQTIKDLLNAVDEDEALASKIHKKEKKPEEPKEPRIQPESEPDVASFVDAQLKKEESQRKRADSDSDEKDL